MQNNNPVFIHIYTCISIACVKYLVNVSIDTHEYLVSVSRYI